MPLTNKVVRLGANAAMFIPKGRSQTITSGPLTVCTFNICKCSNNKEDLGYLMFHQGPHTDPDAMVTQIKECVPPFTHPVTQPVEGLSL
jgi:hypothetical protein